MSTAWLRASLALWRRREAFRKERHDAAQKALDRARERDIHPRRPLVDRRDKWSRLLKEARANIERRERQLHRRPGREGVVRWARAQVGTRERPPGSNRGGKITEWQRALGAWLVGKAWCGTFCAAALRQAGVHGISWRLASCEFIEDDARAKRGPFRGWAIRGARAGDLVILFGRGHHVEIVEAVLPWGIQTIGGNTSSGSHGSQSNGGGVYRRARSWKDVHGFALVQY